MILSTWLWGPDVLGGSSTHCVTATSLKSFEHKVEKWKRLLVYSCFGHLTRSIPGNIAFTDRVSVGHSSEKVLDEKSVLCVKLKLFAACEVFLSGLLSEVSVTCPSFCRC